MLVKDWRNSFCLMDSFSEDKGRSVRAYAVYLNASFFNHSCLPNACHFNYLDTTSHNGNTDLIIRVMHDIPLQGEEVCISYLRVNISYPERQRRLMNDYTFACSCKRCQIEANWSREEGNEIDHKGVDDPDFLHAYLKTFMCERESCRGFLAPMPPSDDGNPSELMECNFCRELQRGKHESDGGACVHGA